MIGDVVVDDNLLVGLLLGHEPPELRPLGGRLATTGLYYLRLCRALTKGDVVGVMSRRLRSAEPHLAQAAMQSIVELPEHVDLASLRSLAMPIARLMASGVRLNLLALEALAAAEHLDAELCLAATNVNPRLVAEAEARDVLVRTISL